MIPLEKQVCSLDLAKRLKELGVKQESVWAWYETTDRDDKPRLNRFDEHCTVCTLPQQQWEEKYSAFTVAELGEMLPLKTKMKRSSAPAADTLGRSCAAIRRTETNHPNPTAIIWEVWP